MPGDRGDRFPVKSMICGILLMIISIMLVVLGGFLNDLVVNANGGKMPVAYVKGDRLGTIALFPRFVKCELDEKSLEWRRGRHTEFTPATKFPLLADRFLFRVLNECEARTLPSFIEAEFRERKLVMPKGETIASIGDLLMLAGLLAYFIALFTLMLTAPFIIFALLTSLRENASQ